MQKRLILMILLFIQSSQKKIKERKIPTTQLMRDEALQGFKLWKNTENKVKY